MISFFSDREQKIDLRVDLHSHLIPEVDDGVKSKEETFEILRKLQVLGIKKVITTPHVYEEVYPNSEEDLQEKYQELLQKMPGDIHIQFELAAEYYADDFFYQKIKKGKELLTFADRYVLVETSFYSRPMILDSILFSLKAEGYKPVLAHPERYRYIGENIELLDHFSGLGALLQVNMGSLVGKYGEASRRIAEYIIRKKKISFLGSDIHNSNHVEMFEKALKRKVLQKLDLEGLLNNQLS